MPGDQEDKTDKLERVKKELIKHQDEQRLEEWPVIGERRDDAARRPPRPDKEA